MKQFRELIEECPVLPAPMCGISDRATRQIARESGAKLIYTQMLSTEGLVRSDRKTLKLLDIEGEEAPVAVQVFGSNPESAAEAARILEDRGVAVVDFNMGCPARKVVGGNCGAALLKRPKVAAAIVRAAVKAVSIPFTVKMRWDWNEGGNAGLRLARICEAEGAAAVCLHARTREAKFGGLAQWDRIAQLKEALSIPVIGNGDIFQGSDAVEMIRQTGCDAVMIGRGILGNPWLIADCLAALRDKDSWRPGPGPSLEDRLNIIRRHAALQAQYKGEAIGLREFRKHAVQYLKGIRNSRPIKNAMMKVQTLVELEEALVEPLLKLDTDQLSTSPH